MSLANTLLVFALIILSGFADSLGFVYASRIWEKDAVSWTADIQQLPAGGSARAGSYSLCFQTGGSRRHHTPVGQAS